MSKTTLTDNINAFVDEILLLTDGRAIWNRWATELAKYRDKTDSTKKLYASKYRAAIRKKDPEHRAASIIRLTRPVATSIRDKYRASVAASNKALIHFPNWKKVIAQAVELIASDKHTEIAIGLCLLTGRRPFEIFCTGEFKAYTPEGQTQPSSDIVLFRGQAKMRGSRADEWFLVPVLCPALDILNAYQKLREKLPDFPNLTGKEFNSRMQVSVSRKTKDVLGELWPKEEKPSPKMLRPLYAEICWKKFPDLHNDMSKAGFFSSILGHDLLDIQTSLTYMDYYLSNKRQADSILRQTTLSVQEKIQNAGHDKK